ncbi:TBC1 domain family member 15 [Linum perenne]
MWSTAEPADSYYEVRPECTDVPKTRFKIKPGKTLSVRKWQTSFSPEGQLDISKTLGRIQRGGIHPTIRGEVWEFLLGCYDPRSTFEEREEIRQRRREEYGKWKEECRETFPIVGSGKFITAPVITEDGEPVKEQLILSETNNNNNNNNNVVAGEPPKVNNNDDEEEDGNGETGKVGESDEAGEGGEVGEEAPSKPVIGETVANGETQSSINISSCEMLKDIISNNGPLDKKVIQWMLTLHQIGLDVIRTDRTLVFYEKQENLSKLWDILAVYAWIDTDVGYCQGMSDLCSPMIILLDDEADAFWCFERLMRRLRGNFRCTESSVGVESQLTNLAAITQVIDPKLHQHLDALGGGDYLFAFRMLMVLFRREFSFCDSLYLWEMMWALEYDPDLFELYEEPEAAEGSKGRTKSIRHYGKYERENMKSGSAAEAPLPISVFLVASVLKDKSATLLQEARGLDDVVKILNDITGNLDAKKACTGAMKLHKKYLKKAKK